MRKKAVIALGGNALIKDNQEGTIYEQFANTREVCKSIVDIIKFAILKKEKAIKFK